MNIFLDIDGVLLANTHNLANHADELLRYILTTYPETTYWLTTHCWKGENRAAEVLSPYLESEIVAFLSSIQPTEWGELKTDAIDFTKPFIWLDDDLLDEERAVLLQHDALSSWIEINLAKNQDQLLQVLDNLKQL